MLDLVLLLLLEAGQLVLADVEMPHLALELAVALEPLGWQTPKGDDRRWLLVLRWILGGGLQPRTRSA